MIQESRALRMLQRDGGSFIAAGNGFDDLSAVSIHELLAAYSFSLRTLRTWLRRKPRELDV